MIPPTPMTDAERDVLFRVTYEVLSTTGACDSPGGGEYQRVREEWVAADRPEDVAAFIRDRANWTPEIDIARKARP